jgi:hypothetical protein
MAKSIPYVCPICTDESYYGRLVFPEETEPPTCPNHKDENGNLVEIILVPAKLSDLSHAKENS